MEAYSKHDIHLTVNGIETDYDLWADVRVSTWPDGSPKNYLSADELREVGEMFIEAADDMEEHENND